ncbi:MAG TPA: hypothetical protein VLC98_15080 [Phnomibacter sp.]|nr:hypothetical protein [Phnomibacter sp.]
MKHIILSIAFCSASLVCLSQNAKKIQKSWVKMAIENLSQKEIATDTLYTRYTFDKSKLYISFYPGWDDYQQEWSIDRDNLTMGFDTYHIEELTDTSLVIKLDGFRKVSLLAEEYLSGQEKYLDSIGVYNGKPLYKANKFITPRYLKGKSLQAQIQKNTSGYNIKKANRFLATFIVTENGEIENIKVVKGIGEGFDKEVVRQLQQTSKDWKAARYKASAIQTEMFYEIKYLDSIVR